MPTCSGLPPPGCKSCCCLQANIEEALGTALLGRAVFYGQSEVTALLEVSWQGRGVIAEVRMACALVPEPAL